MTEEVDAVDEQDVQLAPEDMPEIPHSWLSVFGGCVAFGFVLTIAALSIFEYVSSRPYDLLGISTQTSLAIETFLTDHGIPLDQITAADPLLVREASAQYYRHDYSIHLPASMKVDTLERLLNQKMSRSDLQVSDWIEGGIKQGVTVTFGEYVFAHLRIFAPDERSGYASLATDVPLPTEPRSTLTLPAVSLPTISKVVLPASTPLPTRVDVTNSVSPVSLTLPSVNSSAPESYSGWIPAHKKSDAPRITTDSADDIQLARIPEFTSPDPAVPITPEDVTPIPKVRLAIIVDDGGYGGALTDTILDLDPNLTLAILPNTPHGTEIAKAAHEKGFEIMLHMPMENSDPDLKHPGQINVAMTEEEIKRWTKDALSQIPHVLGVNNHTGSKFTTDAKAMALFMDIIKEADLYFVDSKTTPDTRAYDVSKAFGVPSATRDLFLDHVNETSEIRRRFAEVVKMAQNHGEAIAICHFRPNTAAVLGELLATLEAEGVTLVHASELIQ